MLLLLLPGVAVAAVRLHAAATDPKLLQKAAPLGEEHWLLLLLLEGRPALLAVQTRDLLLLLHAGEPCARDCRALQTCPQSCCCGERLLVAVQVGAGLLLLLAVPH